MSSNLGEILIMYEVSSFSIPGSKESLVQEVVEKANRLLGVQKLALYEKNGSTYKTVIEWGLQEEGNLTREVNGQAENSFVYYFEDGELGCLYLEQHLPVSLQNKRLFTVFARQIENAMKHIRAGEKLEQSEKEKEAILDSISEYLVFLDKNYRILWGNRSAAELAGLSPEELRGCYCYQVFGRYKYSCQECPLTEVLETGTFREGFVNFPDGRHWYLRGFPVKNRVGQVEGMVEVGMDITGKKQAEAELQSSQKIFEMVFNSVNDAIFVYDTLGNIQDVNDTMLQMYRMETRDEARAYSIFEYASSPESREDLASMMERASEGNGYLFEWQSCSPKGNGTFEVEVFLSCLHMENQKLFLATVRDITARKHQEKLLRNLFTYSPIGMYVARKGRILMANSQFEKITGYTEEELKGLNLLDLVVSGYHNKVYNSAVKMLKGEETASYEFKIVNKDGEIRWVVESVASITFHDKRATVGSIMDITERKKAEERLSYLSFHDSLTGLYNRAFLESEMQRLDTERQLPISIVIADVNGLKLVNDTYGHSRGDEVLRHAACILDNSCRREDIIARWGGDEFVVLLPKTSASAVQNLCERINQNCNSVFVEDIPVSMALGYAVKEETNRNLEDVLKEAEDNMYKQKLTESRSEKSAVLNALLRTLGEKSYETEVHTHRMQEIAMKIGEKINLSNSELNRLKLLITLHDIGKINISEDILTRGGSLTESEWEVIKKHPEIGYRIARATEEFSHVAEEILSHHERWDGRGYPYGLEQEQIPLLARITAIADAYEVMSHGRPYKEAMPPEDIMREFEDNSGTQFDPELVEVLFSVLKEGVRV